MAVYDGSGNLVDLPLGDVESIEIEDVINGGSGTGTFIFRRDINNVGAIAYGYTVMVWIWSKRGDTASRQRPRIPYYWGTMVDIDQEKLISDGTITVHVEGWMKQLDRAIVTEEINPSYYGNPSLDMITYAKYLLDTYQPTTFATNTLGVNLPATPTFTLLPNKFDHTKLGACLDTLTKQGRDTFGNLYTWFVRPQFVANALLPDFGVLKPQVVVQPDQNPNVFVVASSTNPVFFKHIFAGISTSSYKIQTKYRDIENVVAIYGGQDPSNGTQVFGVYGDTVSEGLFGPWEDSLQVPALLSNDACTAYATTWTALHGYPNAQGEMALMYPDPTILAGTWVQSWEVVGSTEPASTIKQWRVASVKVSIKDDRVLQTLSPQSPTPYIDEAVYKVGQNVLKSAGRQGARFWVNTQQTYIRTGGDVTGTSSVPAKVTFSGGQAVFAGSLVSYAGGNTAMTDNSGGPLNGQTGDGMYTVSVNSSGTIIVTKNADVAVSDTIQNLRRVTVIAGKPYV